MHIYPFCAWPTELGDEHTHETPDLGELVRRRNSRAGCDRVYTKLSSWLYLYMGNWHTYDYSY
jgi:hypothetical protein